MTETLEKLSQQAFARFKDTVEAYIASEPKNEDNFIRFDHICAALLLNAAYVQTADPSFSGRTQDLGKLVLHTQQKVLDYLKSMQGLSPQLDNDRRLAIQDWQDGTAFARIDTLLENIASLQGKFPYHDVSPANKLAWALYEPVMRENLARIDPVSSENLLLANLLNTRGEDYANNMLRGMLEVSKQLADGDKPMDAAQLIALKSIVSPATSSVPFSTSVNFSVPHERRTMEGIAQMYATLEKLNERYRNMFAIDAHHAEDSRIWRIPVKGGLRSMENVRLVREGGEVNCFYDFPDYKGGKISAKINPSDSVTVEREKAFTSGKSGAADMSGAGLAMEFVDSLFRDYYVGLDEMRHQQGQMTPQQFRTAVLVKVVNLVQDMERAHMFADANSRISSTLLLHRLVGELPARGIHIENNGTMVFHDTWIDMLSAEEAAANLRLIREYPALRMTAQPPRVAGMQPDQAQQTSAMPLMLSNTAQAQVPSVVLPPSGDQMVVQNGEDTAGFASAVTPADPNPSTARENALSTAPSMRVGALPSSEPPARPEVAAPAVDATRAPRQLATVTDPQAISPDQRRRARSI